MKKLIVNIVISAASFLLSVFCFAQQKQLQEIDSLFKENKIHEGLVILKKIDTASLSRAELAEYYYLLGESENKNNKSDGSFKYWLIAREKFKAIDSMDKVAQINLQIVQTLNSLQTPQLNLQPFMDEYLTYAREQNSPRLLSSAYMQLGKIFISSDTELTLNYFKQALAENSKTGDSLMAAKIHHNLGVVYGEHTVHKDSALYHYDLALNEYNRQNLQDYISYIYNNKASVYKQLKNYEKAIEWYRKADSIAPKEYAWGNKRFLYANMAETYELNNDDPNALKYLKLQNVYRDSIDQDEQNKALLDIQTKYEVEKKENENLKLRENRTWLIFALGLTILILFIGYLLYRNLQSRKKISDKENEIEKQQLEKALKDQELAGIDAMIEGQEKERQRIANDLHDHLGSLLVTLKMHFQNLKLRKDRLKEDEDRLMKQTDDLIDEAYHQVRRIAHMKNAGVNAREGLLPAVRNFAGKVSASTSLVIEVEEHGMDEKLENSLEVTIFRIIQELIANIIKHSKATEAVIHLTNHGDMINLLVEDNGQGFEPEKIKVKEGMGIHSIQRRIELLGGSVDIESFPAKGTTIITNIPVQ